MKHMQEIRNNRKKSMAHENQRVVTKEATSEVFDLRGY